MSPLTKKGKKILKAMEFATNAHRGQVRKYTGEPYINHPFAVFHMVRDTYEDTDTLIAALLHDVVEDTEATSAEVRHEFGDVVADYVHALTDIPNPNKNRATRKAETCQRLKLAPPNVKVIKLADLIDNAPSIIKHNKEFAEVFLKEMHNLFLVLNGHSDILDKQAMEILLSNQSLIPQDDISKLDRGAILKLNK